MEFVYEDLGYTKDQVLHSVIHLDEATPHVHCVVVPLVKKLDKRTNTERYTISNNNILEIKFTCQNYKINIMQDLLLKVII